MEIGNKTDWKKQDQLTKLRRTEKMKKGRLRKSWTNLIITIGESRGKFMIKVRKIVRDRKEKLQK